MNKYIESVSHLKKKLERGVSYEKTLHILHKLQKIPISIELLQTTGIGKTIRNLSKSNDDIGKTAKLLCLTWKAIVKEQQEQQLQEQELQEQLQEHEEEEDSYQYNESNSDSPQVRDEPNSDQMSDNSSDEKINRSNDKIKSEYDSSDNEPKVEDNHKITDQNKSKKRNTDEKYSEKSSHKKHKSSHKSKDKSAKTEFEALLGLNDEIIRKKKKNSSNKRSDVVLKTETKGHNSYNKMNDKLIEKSKKYDEKHKAGDDSNGRNDSSHSYPSALDSKTKLKSLEKIDILSSLPTPNYKPLPNRDFIEERVEANRRKTLKVAEDLSLNVQSKKGRTAVFAGHARTNFYTHVPQLEQICLRVLMDNIEKICYVGDAPYYLIKSVLQKCNEKQLSRLERFNPQLMDETDELWEDFCKKEFRGREPDDEEDESWRELYYRCVRERDDKLKNITKHIAHKQTKALPVRQTQFSETAKTPREVLRKQERAAVHHSNSSYSAGHSSSSNSTANHVRIVPEKPKVAPLMKKALKLQKARFRR